MGSMCIRVSFWTGMLSNEPHFALLPNIDWFLQNQYVLVTSSDLHIGHASQSQRVMVPPCQMDILYMRLSR